MARVNVCLGLGLLLMLFPSCDVLQAGYLPFHYLVCNPICPPCVLQAVVACCPSPCRMEFAAQRLLSIEVAESLQAPHHFEGIQANGSNQLGNRYNVARHFREGFADLDLRHHVPVETDMRIHDDNLVSVVVVPKLAEPVWALPLTIAAWQLNTHFVSILLRGGADPHHVQVRAMPGSPDPGQGVTRAGYSTCF